MIDDMLSFSKRIAKQFTYPEPEFLDSEESFSTAHDICTKKSTKISSRWKEGRRFPLQAIQSASEVGYTHGFAYIVVTGIKGG